MADQDIPALLAHCKTFEDRHGVTYFEVTTVEDLNLIKESIEQIAEDWADPNRSGRVSDWENFYDRLEKYLHIDLTGSLTGPVIKRVKDITRAVVKANAE